MASYRKRARGWRAEVSRAGIRESATFPTKAEAVAWATAREAEIISGARPGASNTHTLLDAMNRYARDVSTAKRGAKWEHVRFAAFKNNMKFVRKRIASILPEDIAEWRDMRLASVSPSTIRRELSLLSSVFNYAVKEWRWCSSNPINDITLPKEAKPRDRRISQREIDIIISALGYVDGCIPDRLTHELAIAFLLALETAMRQGEMLSLTWDRVFFEQRYVRLDITKNGHARDVPLSTKAVQLLRILQQANGSKTAVFTISSASADALFRKARSRTDLVDLHFHDTRHEATTRLAQKLSVLELARMTGHKDPRSLMVYYNATATELARLLD